VTDRFWDEARSIFADALDVDTDERGEFLVKACNGDARLLAEVEALLRHHGCASSFLDDAPETGRGSTAALVLPGEIAPDAPRPKASEGMRVADRYVLGDKLGEGGCGVVYEAEDTLTGERVAIKLLSGLSEAAREAVRREVATLRLLRMPGVVQLLDDGITEDWAFIVMELVEGAPFPGPVSRPARWNEIGEVVLGVLDTLARIHWAGVIHRDIKPSNVLVLEDGTPLVLDMGVSAGPAVSFGRPDSGNVAGTPKYVPPEQWFGASPSARGDLYSLGVMVYEALGGEIPMGEVWQFPPLRGQRPVREVAPDTPRHVAALVDRLLDADPAKRPESAVEARALLVGETTDPVSGRRLPRLGPPEPLEAIVEAAKERRAIDLAGPAGTGRTRCLKDACECLEREGYEVYWTSPKRRPLRSLADVVGALEAEDEGLEEARALVRRRLSNLLESGCIVLCDDFESLDRWSREMLEECRSLGCIVRVVPGATAGSVQLRALAEEDLRVLFAGPERIHHLPDDAATELMRRTQGLPSAVAAELNAWVRAALARWEGDKVVISRSALERLRGGLHALPPGALSVHRRPALDDQLEDLLVCIDIAGPHATVPLLQKMLDVPLWTVEAEIADLERAGAVRRLEEGRLKVVVPTHAGHLWPPERRREIHQKLGTNLEPRATGRFYHLIAADMLDEAVDEAIAVARQLMREGIVDRAMSILREGLSALARRDGDAREDDLLMLLLEGALVLCTTDAINTALYHLGRARLGGAVRESLETTARAALLTLEGDAERALRMLDDADPPPRVDIARWRYSVRVIAASFRPLEQHEEIVRDAAQWALQHRGHGVAAARWEWLGWLAYRKANFETAAQLHARAAEEADTALHRAAALLNAAWASLEAFDLEATERLAKEAEGIARQCRHAHYEGRGEVLRRCAAYRGERHGPPDRALVDATHALGVAFLHGCATLNEAAVAWRRGQRTLARDLAIESTRAFKTAGERGGELLASALAYACGEPRELPAVAELAQAARDCPLPGIAVQAIGLLHLAGEKHDPAWGADLESIAERLPRDTWPLRREVASVREAIDWWTKA